MLRIISPTIWTMVRNQLQVNKPTWSVSITCTMNMAETAPLKYRYTNIPNIPLRDLLPTMPHLPAYKGSFRGPGEALAPLVALDIIIPVVKTSSHNEVTMFY